MFNVSEKSSFIAWIFLQRGGCHTVCKARENCEFAKFCVLLECYGTSENNLLRNAKVYYMWTSEATSQLLTELLFTVYLSFHACLYVKYYTVQYFITQRCAVPLIYVTMVYAVKLKPWVKLFQNNDQENKIGRTHNYES